MRRLLFTTSALVALAAPAWAEETETLTADPLPEVIVTATRLPAIAARSPGARVIDQTAIQRRGAVFAADILADLPGLSVVRTGAFGGVAQVRIRGANPGKTLVLIDGVPVNDPAEINGAYDFSGLELAEIERIEVLSGPQSSLWGSDAIGGVIAFTTAEISGVRAQAEAGSLETLRGRLAAGVTNDAYAFGAWVSRFSTDGISAADEADGNPETDGLDSTTVGARGRYALSSAARIDGSVRWSRNEADIDGFPAPRFRLADTADSTESEQWSGFARLTVATSGLVHQFSLSASDIQRDTVSRFPSTFEADRQVWRWQANGSSSERLTYAFGAEREDTQGSLSSGLVDELGTTSVFGTASVQATTRLTLTGAVRWDDTDDFGSETTGRVSAALDLDSGFILSGAWGTGFKAPSISQAVCDFCFALRPFPVLRPESADGFEAALGWTAQDGRLDGRITLYRLNVEDQIAYVAGRYINIARTRTDGIEAEATAQLGGGLDLTLAYAWTDARDETTDARLLRVPEHAGSATLAWSGERLSGALTLRAEGDQDDAGGVRDGFVTANLNGAYRLTDGVDLTARIENLADERYQQVLGYGEPGRSAYIGVRLRY